MNRHHLKTRKVDKALIEVICADCHDTIHAHFTNRELSDPESILHTIEGLLAHPEFDRAVHFIRKQDPGARVRVRTSKRKGRR